MMILQIWRKLTLAILTNIDRDVIDRACIMVNKSEQELLELDISIKACTTSIFKCIIKKCPSLHMCYDGLEVIE